MRSLALALIAAALLLAPQPARAVPGDPVRSFGRAGVATIPLGDASPFTTLVAQQPGGRILVGAVLRADGDWHGPAGAVFGLTPRGSLDRSFGRQGRLGSELSIGAVTMQPDGKLLFARPRPRSLSRSWLRLTRYTAAGKLDRSFGRGGTLRVPLTQTPDARIDVAVAPDGDLVVAADTSDERRPGPLMLMRLTAAGALDAGFGSGGRMLLPAGDDLRAPEVAVQRSGRIVVLADVDSRAGLGGQGVALVGVRPDGTLDTTFGGYGDGTRALTVRSARLALAQDDEIVLLVTPNGPERAIVMRLPPDAAGPVRETPFPSPVGASAQQLALDERGAAIVSGGEHFSTRYWGLMRGFVARFGRDAFDPVFHVGAPDRRALWTSDDAGPLAVSSDGTILASANRPAEGDGHGAIKLLRLFGGYDAQPPAIAARTGCRRGRGLLSVEVADESQLTSLDVRSGATLLRRFQRKRIQLRVPRREALTVYAVDASGNAGTRRLAGPRCEPRSSR